MSTVPESNVYARDLVLRMFRDAADEDYITARWAARNNLHHQFLWSMQQAIEKYLKAALLLNDESISESSHGLPELFNLVLRFSGDLVPIVLCPPHYFGTHYSNFFWNDADRRRFPFRATTDFIEYVSSYGNSNVRYRHHSITVEGEVLHEFDEVCFSIRRLAMPLNMEYGSTGRTCRDVLLSNRRLQIHGRMSFQPQLASKRSRGLSAIFAWRNFSYFEDQALRAGKIHTGGSAINSAIAMNVHHAGVRAAAVQWLIGKGKFNSSERAAIKAILGKNP